MHKTEVFLVDRYLDILCWMKKSSGIPLLSRAAVSMEQTPCTNTGAKCPPITRCDHQMAAVLQCCRGHNGLGAAAAVIVNFKSAIVNCPLTPRDTVQLPTSHHPPSEQTRCGVRTFIHNCEDVNHLICVFQQL